METHVELELGKERLEHGNIARARRHVERRRLPRKGRNDESMISLSGDALAK